LRQKALLEHKSLFRILPLPEGFLIATMYEVRMKPINDLT
jgi:hypothetical protein